jgi:phospholipase A2
MFTLKRRLNKRTVYQVKRGLSSTSCNKSPRNVTKSTCHSQIWTTQSHSKKKDDQDDSQKESERDDNAFISSLFSDKAWLSAKIDWLDELPSVDAINAKMAQLYPHFTSQFTHLREGYKHMWDYLTMEDFRKIVDEINEEAKDPNKFPEITKDAHVR